MSNEWTIQIIGATQTFKKFEIKNERYPGVSVEIIADSENEAWEKFNSAFKNLK
ncbi:hypothetical protein ACFVS2_20430 [Brevibacillus sp. NPDC058079]|uniref:hypothetical protein n=1 Tax=Brevibacillus sp. NPDC058079 TaxID=3346330 RepID=UPI0036E933D9